MEDVLGADGAGPRFNTWLLSLLASAALVLATVGIYGVIAYFVTQRTAEIGLRLALGATPASVLMMVVRRGAVLAAAGITIGVLAALAATRMVTTLLFEIYADRLADLCRRRPVVDDRRAARVRCAGTPGGQNQSDASRCAES